MERFFDNMCLDESDEEEKLEPLEEKELKLMNLIKSLIRKRMYRKIPLLFTTGKNAASNLEMLPRMWLHLYREVCRKHLTEDNFEEHGALYRCVEQLLVFIGEFAPAHSFLFELTLLMDLDNPDCVFFSTLAAAGSPLMRVEDVTDFIDFLDEIDLRKKVCLPTPLSLLMPIGDEMETHMSAEDEIPYITMFYAKLYAFYKPLVPDICAPANREKEIFRSCKTNKRNAMCCFLLKMLEKPLALFDLECAELDGIHKGPLCFAVSLTRSVTSCIGDPYFLLNFVEQKVRCGSQTDKPSLNHENEECANHFLKEFEIESECLAIYYYMIIVVGVGSSQVPSVYHPLYVCEKILHLVHYILREGIIPTLHEKALRLARKLLGNLGHLKLQESDLELYIHKTFLSDLRLTACTTISAQVLVETTEVLGQYVKCFDDPARYIILKNLLKTSTDPNFSSFLICQYKHFVADALKTPSLITLPEIYTGPKMRSMLMESICTLQHGAKTDPAKNNNRLEAALQIILMLSKNDTDNRTGFRSYIEDIYAQFITPLREALPLYDGRYKSELVNARQGRGNVANIGRINDLKNKVADIVKLRILASVVCESLSHISTDDQNNNNFKSNSAKTK